MAVSASRNGPALNWGAGLAGLGLEAEIRSLNMMAPEMTSQLPTLFAETVVKSCYNVLGESSGEALVRRIGDDKLVNPDYAFRRIDLLLQGGSDSLKKAIRASFRTRVHRLYRTAVSANGPGNW